MTHKHQRKIEYPAPLWIGTAQGKQTRQKTNKRPYKRRSPIHHKPKKHKGINSKRGGNHTGPAKKRQAMWCQKRRGKEETRPHTYNPKNVKCSPKGNPDAKVTTSRRVGARKTTDEFKLPRGGKKAPKTSTLGGKKKRRRQKNVPFPTSLGFPSHKSDPETSHKKGGHPI